VVDERGRVIDPRIVRSSERVFEESTLRAISKWQFEPGRRQGKVVRFRMTVPVMFNLHEGS
jgi:protein TonB